MADNEPLRSTPPRRDRQVALFLVCLVTFNPPFLGLFGADVTVAGIPLLFVYIFSVWAGVIALLAVQIERAGRTMPAPKARMTP